MNNFFISQVTAYSPLGLSSVIDLEPGVNIICGPSNTGKTMVVACIDYLFGGSKEPLDPSVEGYDKVSMRLVNANGEPVTIHRSIGVKDGNATPSNKVTIVSEVDGIRSGEYKLNRQKDPDEKTYGDILLGMLDIQKPVQIIANQKGKPNRLTFRTFFHQFCIKEDNIFSDQTIVEKPGYNSVTSSVNALAYLLYEGGVQDGEYEDPKIKTAKKRAVMTYISEKMSMLTSKREELRARIEDIGETDIDSRMSEIIEEIADIDKEIEKARTESQQLLQGIYETTDKLTNEQQLKERYRALHTQYDSDVSRLRFIIEGEDKATSDIAQHCPFCNSEIAESDERESYTAASKAELEKVYLQLTDLETLEAETNEYIEALRNRLSSLSAKNSNVKSLISKEFTPKAEALHHELSNYKRIVQLRQELAAIENLTSDFSEDISKRASEDDSTNTYDAKEMFDKTVFNRLSSAVGRAVKECHYPDCQVAGLLKSSFDIVVNNKEKKHEGKGYRAFLNSLYAFVLMKFIEDEGKHAPKMLILDSPILSLKEDVSVPATDSMKKALFDYIIDNCGSCQIIIAENELPDDVDYKTANIIEFSRGPESGREGFLRRE